MGIILQGLRYVLLGLSCVSIYLYVSSLHLLDSFSGPVSQIFLEISFLQTLSVPPCAGKCQIKHPLHLSICARLASWHLPLAQHQRPSQLQVTSSRRSVEKHVCVVQAGNCASAKGCKWAANVSQRKHSTAHSHIMPSHHVSSWSCSACLAPCATSKRHLDMTITTPVPRCVGNDHLPQQAQTSAPTIDHGCCHDWLEKRIRIVIQDTSPVVVQEPHHAQFAKKDTTWCNHIQPLYSSILSSKYLIVSPPKSTLATSKHCSHHLA